MSRFVELRIEVLEGRLVLDKRLLVLGLVGVKDAAGSWSLLDLLVSPKAVDRELGLILPKPGFDADGLDVSLGAVQHCLDL